MSNPIVRINCPTCNRKLKIPERSIEKAIVCPKCNTTFRVEGQSSTVVVDGRNDWFGPPVSDEYSKGEFGSDPFGEIEKIIDQYEGGREEAEEKELPNPAAVRAKHPQTMRQLDQQIKVGNGREPRRNNIGDDMTPVKTPQEKSLANNAVGLLILAFGLSLLPLAGGAVPGLRDLLPMLSIAAVLLAFLACFMLAYSRRRESIASLILAGLPLIFVGLIGFGSHYFSTNFLTDLDSSRSVAGNENGEDEPFFEPELPLNLDGNGEADESEDVEIEAEIDESDRLTIDPNSINNNPASKFVPRRSPKPISPSSDAADSRSPTLRIAQENSVEEREISNPESNGKPPVSQQNDIVEQLDKSLEQQAMRGRYQRLLRRTQRELDNGVLEKGLVSSGEIKRPDELRQEYELSSIAGRSTVYGTAYFSRNAIAGFDFAYRNHNDELVDVLVPAIEEGEFQESLVPPPGYRMTGLNLFLKEGVCGMQCVYSKGSVSEVGPWYGKAPGNESTVQLETENGIHGIVVYRDRWDVVGLQLITRSSPVEPAAQ